MIFNDDLSNQEIKKELEKRSTAKTKSKRRLSFKALLLYKCINLSNKLRDKLRALPTCSVNLTKGFTSSSV